MGLRSGRVSPGAQRSPLTAPDHPLPPHLAHSPRGAILPCLGFHAPAQLARHLAAVRCANIVIGHEMLT